MADPISAMPPSLTKETSDAISLRGDDEKSKGSNVDINVLAASDASVDLENGEEVHD